MQRLLSLEMGTSIPLTHHRVRLYYFWHVDLHACGLAEMQQRAEASGEHIKLSKDEVDQVRSALTPLPLACVILRFAPPAPILRTWQPLAAHPIPCDATPSAGKLCTCLRVVCPLFLRTMCCARPTSTTR